MAHSHLWINVRMADKKLNDPSLTRAIPEHLRDESYSVQTVTQASCLVYFTYIVGRGRGRPVPSPIRLGDLEERRDLPQRVLGADFCLKTDLENSDYQLWLPMPAFN